MPIDPLKKGDGKGEKTLEKIKRENNFKKKELSYESFFKGIRLTIRPWTRSRHALFGRARQNIYIRQVFFHLT